MNISKFRFFVFLTSYTSILSIVFLLYQSWFARVGVLRKAQVAQLQLTLDNLSFSKSRDIKNIGIAEVYKNCSHDNIYLSVHDGKVMNEFGDYFIVGSSRDQTKLFIHLVEKGDRRKIGSVLAD